MRAEEQVVALQHELEAAKAATERAIAEARREAAVERRALEERLSIEGLSKNEAAAKALMEKLEETLMNLGSMMASRYIAPFKAMSLPPQGTYGFTFWLVLGNIDTIRAYAQQVRPHRVSQSRFGRDMRVVVVEQETREGA